MANSKKAASLKKPRNRKARLCAALVLENTAFLRDGVGEHYELIAIPLDAVLTAVEDYNDRKAYGADMTPLKRAVACVVFAKSPTKESPKGEILEALRYDFMSPDFDEEHPLQKRFALISHVAGRAFETGLQVGLAQAKLAQAARKEASTKL
jgi:hypothetical protein